MNDPWFAEFLRSIKLDDLSLAFFAGIQLFTLFGLFFSLNQSLNPKTTMIEMGSLLLFVSAGMMLLVSANHLLVAFLALELMSLPTYVLVGLQRQKLESAEASLKYFLYGSLATVLIVLGMAIAFSSAGSLHLPTIQSAIVSSSVNATPSASWLIMLGLFIVGTGFKVGAFPFHMWLPDAYQGASSSITAFMGSAVKLSAFGLIIRLFWGGFEPLSGSWRPVLQALAIMSILSGNIAAIVQTNVKRMFAFSSIAHAGYVLLLIGTATPTFQPTWSLYYYLLVYGLMFLGLFGALSVIEDQQGRVTLNELKGLGFTRPLFGFCLLVFVLTAAGIPPTAGFLSKYFLLWEVAKQGYYAQVIVAVIGSLIGVYYYLQVLVALYMQPSSSQQPLKPRVNLFGIVACTALLVLGTISPALLTLFISP